MKEGFVVEIGVRGIGGLSLEMGLKRALGRAMGGVERKNVRRRQICGMVTRKI